MLLKRLATWEGGKNLSTTAESPTTSVRDGKRGAKSLTDNDGSKSRVVPKKTRKSKRGKTQFAV